MSPEMGGRWIRQAQMPVYVGGAELNVATALSRWKKPARYVTALPQNELSTDIVTEINGLGIDTSSIVYSGERIGIYFLPQGGDLKGAGVIYDRAHSSFAGLKRGMIDWKKALKGCDWFHFSAISPALNRDVADVCAEGIEAAFSMGLKISVDLNYRQKLWKYGVAPTEIMPALTKHCHVVMGNIWAVESLLDIPSPIKESKGKTRQELIDAAKESMQMLREKYSRLESVAYTFRLENEYWAALQHESGMFTSREYGMRGVVDRVGSGDCFMGGLIYGLSSGNDPQDVIDFAAAAAVNKLREKGDATSSGVEIIRQLMNENG